MDEPVVTLTSIDDVNARRAALRMRVFGQASLPTSQAVVTPNVTPPDYGLANVARVDHFTGVIPGQPEAYHYYLWIPTTTRLYRLVIFDPGHGHSIDTAPHRTQEMFQSLLNAGYDVLESTMGIIAGSWQHNEYFASHGDAAGVYLLQPVCECLNYLDVHTPYADCSWVGLSGGGWMATIYGALDTRISRGVSIEGTLPGYYFLDGASGTGLGDAEQRWRAFFTIAGYADCYAMAAHGAGRAFRNIYGRNGLFGPNSFDASYQSHYGKTWDEYLAMFTTNIAGSSASLGGVDYDTYIDESSVDHQFGTDGQAYILNYLPNTPETPPPPPPPPTTAQTKITTPQSVTTENARVRVIDIPGRESPHSATAPDIRLTSQISFDNGTVWQFDASMLLRADSPTSSVPYLTSSVPSGSLVRIQAEAIRQGTQVDMTADVTADVV